jgi:MSHA biogenesis protein MshJ
MKQLWQQWTARVDALALRERILLLAVVLVVTVLAFDALWLGPVQQELGAERQRLEQLTTRHQALSASLAELQAREAVDPEAAPRQRMGEIRAETARLDEQLRERTLRLIPPQQMTAVLEDLIRGSEALTLLSMRSEPALSMGREGVGGEGEGSDLPVFYRHGLVMELSGDYLALLAYLRTVEAMPWGLFWEALEVRAQDTGPSRFVIRVFTLSFDEDWIGV